MAFPEYLERTTFFSAPVDGSVADSLITDFHRGREVDLLYLMRAMSEKIAILEARVRRLEHKP